MQDIVFGEHSSVALPTKRGLDLATAATVRLALHCLTWDGSLPIVDGELGWEECFVGPLVSSAFAHLVDKVGSQGWTARWTG